jgi:hypothetical protein
VRALLLDVLVPSAVAVQLRARGLDVLALPEWHGGLRLNWADLELIRFASLEQRTFVSFDVNTLPPILDELAYAGEEHAGVILVSRNAFRQNDVGGLVRALEHFVRHDLPDDMTNQVLYLPR